MSATRAEDRGIRGQYHHGCGGHNYAEYRKWCFIPTSGIEHKPGYYRAESLSADLSGKGQSSYAPKMEPTVVVGPGEPQQQLYAADSDA